jgi:hypothetical protein
MLRVLDGKEEHLIKAPFLWTRTRSVAETKRINGIQIGMIIWMRIPGMITLKGEHSGVIDTGNEKTVATDITY